LVAVPGTGEAFVVDLADVTFLDSVGIVALVTAHKKAAAAGQTLTVVNPRGVVRRVLDLTGVFPMLSGHDGPGQEPV
jgi:anti-anti-sigma factor